MLWYRQEGKFFEPFGKTPRRPSCWEKSDVEWRQTTQMGGAKLSKTSRHCCQPLPWCHKVLRQRVVLLFSLPYTHHFSLIDELKEASPYIRSISFSYRIEVWIIIWYIWAALSISFQLRYPQHSKWEYWLPVKSSPKNYYYALIWGRSAVFNWLRSFAWPDYSGKTILAILSALCLFINLTGLLFN